MTLEKHRMGNVLVAFPVSRIARTDKLAGIYRYQRGTMPWDLRLVPTTVTLDQDPADDLVAWASAFQA